MDPLSVSAAVVGLLTAGATLTNALTTIVRESRHAPEKAQHVLQEIRDIGAALGSLQSYLTRQA